MPQQRILHTAVIGAGQAGLSAGYYLRHRALDFVILDANERTGDSWRNRWEGLRLFSPNRYNALPGLPPSGGDWELPDRLELADYLEGYAAHWRIPIRHGVTVTECLPPEGENAYWTILTNGEVVFAERLIVATGAYRTPAIPEATANAFPASILQVHSSEVRDAQDMADANTDVLVLGAGASGQQLSRLFHEAGSNVMLAGPKVANLPRRLLGKDIYWWLYKSGMMTAKVGGFPGKFLVSDKGDVTVGEPKLPSGDRLQRIKTKVRGYENGSLVFDCKKTMPEPLPWPSAGKQGLVIWCTGYHNQYPFLPASALDEKGQPNHAAGKSNDHSGLFFLGLPNLARPNSSLTGGVGEDAERIVEAL